jgi:uncharacterized protein
MFRRITALAAIASIGAVLVAAPAGARSTSDPAAHLTLDGAGTTQTTAGFDKLATAVLTDVDAYWTKVFKANNLAEPTVTYDWIPAGQSVVDGCSGEATDGTAAFYCPSDDTIYLDESFAAAVRDGNLTWPSGDRPNTPLGDAAVAYVIAHEEGHNVQAELGVLNAGLPTYKTELHADCLAGAWLSNAKDRNLIDDNDVESVRTAAWLVGDEAFDNPSHHGTPQQRLDAVDAGIDSLSNCSTYLR